MYTKELILLTGTTETRKTLVNQLQEVIGDFVRIHHFSIEEGIPHVFSNQLIILSTSIIEEETAPYIGSGCKVVVAKRTVNFEHIDKLLFLPENTDALYVNDAPETVYESIETLLQMGINHIRYHPFYPGKKNYAEVKIAITPGEINLVPPFIQEVVNIGPRLIDITTLMTILQHLHLMEKKGDIVSEKYIRKIIDLSQKLSKTTKESDRLNKHLKQVLDGVNDGILAVNNKGVITVFNENLAHMLGMHSTKAIGRNLQDIFRNPELIGFILDDSREEWGWFSIFQTDVIVHRFYLETEGAIVATFKNAHETIEVEKTIRRELVKKGYIAKYTFQDIQGVSSSIQKCKQIAAKIAKTNLTVLIEGESGTGKELFASAIHNESLRQDGPFLAVNFSALPDDLVESELFGYEEGAFTGAKKGGKVGLFEQANGGTLFLDEIGDISLKLQARLLRVLQEKEIMRIGGNKIIPIDVRIIAATNKNLLHMIEQGTYRADLYHRLKILFIHLPELRNRKADIPHLVKVFLRQSGRSHMQIMPEVMEHLIRYQWNGNVRELKNIIDYMLAVCDDSSITLDDLPSESFFQPTASNALSRETLEELPSDTEEFLFILETIFTNNQLGESIGRKKIAEKTQAWKKDLSEQQLRTRLKALEERGFILTSRGRTGIKLTSSGLDYLTKKENRPF
ncbi:sigma 54-interacting transcriptional regulator [Brevibacillus invocatus]|uniref:sigma 54-interacting transcriptional regulator n=1 Tax=Brevibacillus invocatus TaxID=173959 RepID=UPI00203E4F96|nr:sigma 54-interacting transcriptional regulator [Brevibacillus invocatus]MCM3081519.1 sigma 54-interacting transcriptional regulator [Brevibacillus invocatus]MCM3431912.1 sigma 54-interacting transcriptional regulator [Brevibacillus invocatus]